MRHATLPLGFLVSLAHWACLDPSGPGDEEASISFLRSVSPGFVDLFVVEASGGGLTRLLDNTGVHGSHITFSTPHHQYEWSPDGDKVAFAYEDGAGLDRLGVVDATGSALIDVSDLNWHVDPLPMSFSWSPDQSRIALARLNKVSVVNPDGSGLHDIVDSSGVRNTGSFWGAQWSPDGTQIAFYGSEQPFSGPLQLINAGGDEHVILPTSAVSHPRWSPDATRLAVVSHPGGRIHIINRDGSGGRFLAQGFFPEWSPDGARLVFIAARYSEPCGEGTCEWYDVMVVNADGSGLAQLTNNGPVDDYDPVWSPDGSRIAFVSDRDGNREVYLMNPDGSGLVNLTQDPADDYAPRWVPRPGG